LLPSLADTMAASAPYDDEHPRLLPYLTAASERETEEPPLESATDGDDRPGVPTKCSEDHGGTAGEPTAGRNGNRYGIRGPADNADPHLASRRRPESAATDPGI